MIPSVPLPSCPVTPDEATESASDLPPERPSKTQRKKASHGLQDLGVAVVELPEDRLLALGLDETLLDAIQQYRRTRSHEGRRRQMQYIGKLMRRVDPEPIQEAVAAAHMRPAKDSLALHEAERWRADLIAADDAVGRFVHAHPGCDTQRLRSLVRAARADASAVPEQRSGRAFRDLFRFIRDAQEAPDA